MSFPDPERVAPPRLAHQVRGFFIGSLAGLAADLMLFQLLSSIGVPPSVSNVASSIVAITVTYFLATRFAFGDRARPLTYVLFVVWYLISIAGISFLIGWAFQLWGGQPIVWKVLSLPLSFAINFLASRTIFGATRARRPDSENT